MHEMMALSMCLLGYIRSTWGVHLLFRLGKIWGWIGGFVPTFV